MTARNLAKDGAPQSFTRSMYLCYTAPQGRPAARAPRKGTMKPFLLQPGSAPPPARRPVQRACDAIDNFLLGFSGR